MNTQEIITELRAMGRPDSLKGMAKYGISTDKAFGVSIPDLRKMAKRTGKNTKLAEMLWSAGIHEARILASMIAEAEEVSKSLMDKWVRDFNSWDLCDQCCNNLFVYTPHAIEKSIEWSYEPEEFIKRAGFVLMAVCAVHRKELKNEEFGIFLRRIKEESIDNRNFVRKGINWALRQIGKRNKVLNNEAIKIAKEILAADPSSGNWIASDALRELTNSKIKGRLKDN